MRVRLASLLAVLCVVPAAYATEIRPSADGGFLTAWHVYGPASKKRRADVLATEPGTTSGWRTVVSPAENVDAGKPARPRKGAATWFGLVVVCDRALDLELKLGTDGDAVVFVDQKEVSRQQKSFYSLWDDHRVPLRLEKGRHSLVIETTRKEKQRNAGWTIVARIHDRTTSAVPAGLRFELPGLTDLERRRAEATSLQVTRTLTRTGYALTLTLAVTGSAPVGPLPKFEVRLGRPKAVVARGRLGETKHVELKGLADKRHRLVVEAAGHRWEEEYEFRKAWNEGLLDAQADLKRMPATLPVGTRESLIYNRDKLERLVLEGIDDHTWLTGEVRRVQAWAAAAAAGKDPLATERGDLYRAYRSRYDGNLQPFSVHVPKRYDRSRKWPLVIGMHGIGSGTHYTLRRVLGRDRDKEGGEPGGKPLIRGNMPRLPDYGVLTASAWGYHNSAFWYYGEDDVMRVIAEMKKAYNVDEDRVYLTGLSLGGLGTYHIGHHFPDAFGALGPLGGFSSVKLYRQIRNYDKRWWESVLIEQRDATTYAENGKHTPMRVVHGKFDAPRHATAMTDRYKKLGYTYELDIPDLGHDVWQHGYGEGKLIKWMKRHRRPANPDDVVLKTHSYRYTRAYWVEIGWIDDYLKPALLEVSVNSKDRSRVSVLKATNLRGFTLDLSRPQLADGPVTVSVAGNDIPVTRRDRVHFRRADSGSWAVANSAAPPKGWKRPGVSGPVDDVMYEPHTFVVGTRDAAQTDVNRRLVSEDRSYIRHRNHDIWFPVKDDVDVTEDDLQTKHLVLYGNPKSNAVLARVLAAGKLPVQFEDDAIVVDGQRFAGEDVGIKLIYPSPFNAERSVVIVAGVTWRGTLLSRHLPRFVPDIMVYDHRLATDYFTRVLQGRGVLYGNFFNEDWTLPKPQPR